MPRSLLCDHVAADRSVAAGDDDRTSDQQSFAAAGLGLIALYGQQTTQSGLG